MACIQDLPLTKQVKDLEDRLALERTTVQEQLVALDHVESAVNQVCFVTCSVASSALRHALFVTCLPHRLLASCRPY